MTPQLDELAHALEMKWGVDRLPRLVTPETAERFRHWRQKLDDAIEHGGDTTDLAGIVMRGWQAMDAEATARGASPLPAACYSIRLDDGVVAEFALDDEHARVLDWRARTEGRTVKLMTLANYARLCDVAGLAVDTLALWPGALVAQAPAEMRPGRRKMSIADDIPFPNPDAEEAA